MEGQLEDIREQEEDNMSLPVHLDKTPVVEKDIVTDVTGTAQLEVEDEEENHLGRGVLESPQLSMEVEDVGHNLQDLLQENQNFPLQQQDDLHLSPRQHHDDMLVGGNH